MSYQTWLTLFCGTQMKIFHYFILISSYWFLICRYECSWHFLTGSPHEHVCSGSWWSKASEWSSYNLQSHIDMLAHCCACLNASSDLSGFYSWKPDKHKPTDRSCSDKQVWNGRLRLEIRNIQGLWLTDSPVLAVVTAVRLLVGMTKFDVVSQRGWWWTGHITKWTFIMVDFDQRTEKNIIRK